MSEFASRALDVPPASSSGALVHVPDAVGLHAPSLCACCLQPGGAPQRLEAGGRPALVLQYCSECHAHASAGRTRWLAAGFASALLGLTTAAALVLAFGFLQPAVQALLAAVSAALPALALLSRAPRPPHTARGPATWWAPGTPEGWTLVCTNGAWASRLAQANGVSWETTRRAPRRWPWPLLVSVSLAALAVPAAHGTLGVDVRVLNRHPTAAILLVDGRHSGVVPSSTLESPAAGLHLRLVAGRRHILLVGKNGQILTEATTALRPSADHLVVASPDPVCFWIERSFYGRSRSEQPARELLLGAGPVWALPGPIDSWFGPNPPGATFDTHSSGGALLALRQGRCLPSKQPPP